MSYVFQREADVCLYKMVSNSITAKLASFSNFVNTPSHLDWFVGFHILNGLLLPAYATLVDEKLVS